MKKYSCYFWLREAYFGIDRNCLLWEIKKPIRKYFFVGKSIPRVTASVTTNVFTREMQVDF